MLLIFAIIIIMGISFYSPITASIVAILSAIYFYKNFQRNKYMTNREVDIAIRLKSIKDPEERKKLKDQIEKNKMKEWRQIKTSKIMYKTHNKSLKPAEIQKQHLACFFEPLNSIVKPIKWRGSNWKFG